MTSPAYNTRAPGSSGARTNGPQVGKRVLIPYRTTATERFLLIVTVVLLPLQDHLPATAGFSVIFIIFALLLFYVILYRPWAFAQMGTKPVFLTAYTLLAVAFLIESAHPDPGYSLIFRMGQMIIGAIIVASLCRDQQALRIAAYGYLIVGIWISIVLFLSSYGTLSEAMATNFHEASQMRATATEEISIEVDLNFMGFVAAQGTVVALALAMAGSSVRRRYFFLGAAVLCFVATFLPMSRSASAIVILVSGIIMLAYGVRHIRTIMIAICLGASLVVLVPQVVFSRLTLSTQAGNNGKMEARAYLYTTALKHLPEYVLTGVGAGNYWNSWAMQRGFPLTRIKGQVKGPKGPHSWYFAITIYWGVAGLLVLIALIYQAYRCLPSQCGASPLSLCLLGVATSMFLYMFVSHGLNGKEFSIGLGLLAAARYWIWPGGVVLPRVRGRWPIMTSIRPAGAFTRGREIVKTS